MTATLEILETIHNKEFYKPKESIPRGILESTARCLSYIANNHNGLPRMSQSDLFEPAIPVREAFAAVSDLSVNDPIREGLSLSNLKYGLELVARNYGDVSVGYVSQAVLLIKPNIFR